MITLESLQSSFLTCIIPLIHLSCFLLTFSRKRAKRGGVSWLIKEHTLLEISSMKWTEFQWILISIISLKLTSIIDLIALDTKVLKY